MKANDKGLLKTFSKKWEFRPLQSYQGRAIFEAIGLNRSLKKILYRHLSRIEGIGHGGAAREGS